MKLTNKNLECKNDLPSDLAFATLSWTYFCTPENFAAIKKK